MRPLITGTFVLSSLAAGTAAAAAQQPAPVAVLQTGLETMVQPLTGQGTANKPADPDQGDDHAAAIAIQRVCNKDGPAAEHSAICPVPISPE